MLVVNGWQIFAHPLLLDQIERLTAAVARAKTKDPQGFQKSANAKLLAALRKLMLETIPSDPTRPEYRQGGTLGANRKHWFRAKFGGQRFRLFFRYDSAAKIILFAWVNDTDTLTALPVEIGRIVHIGEQAGLNRLPAEQSASVGA
jgi:toxin YhaV